MFEGLKINDILNDDNLECYEYRGFDSFGKTNQYFYEEPKTGFESDKKDFIFKDTFISDPRLTRLFEVNENAKITMNTDNTAVDVNVDSEYCIHMIILINKSRRQARFYAGDILANTIMTFDDSIVTLSYVDNTVHITFTDRINNSSVIKSIIGIPQKNLFAERAISEWTTSLGSITYWYDKNGLLLNLKSTDPDINPTQLFRREIHYYLKEYEGKVCYNMPYFVSSNQFIVNKPGTRIFFVDNFKCIDGKTVNLQRSIYIVNDEDKYYKLKQMLSSSNDNIIL